MPHRVKPEWAIDAICRYCYVTIESSAREADLEQMDASFTSEMSMTRASVMDQIAVIRTTQKSTQDWDRTRRVLCLPWLDRQAAGTSIGKESRQVTQAAGYSKAGTIQWNRKHDQQLWDQKLPPMHTKSK